MTSLLGRASIQSSDLPTYRPGSECNSMANTEELEAAELASSVALHVALPASIDLDRVTVAFGSDTAWLGEPLPPAASGTRLFACDLELRVLPDRRATFRKSAVVGLGEPVRDRSGWIVPIEWRAATHAPLLPVFAGYLRLTGRHLELDGQYLPPGGTVGYVLDRVLLHSAANGTGRWLLQKVIAAVGSG
jgi:hypothetical protein